MDMRKTVVIGIAACAFLLLVALLVGHYYGPASDTNQSQTAWNSQTIRGSLAGVQVHEVDPAHAAVLFLYDVDNRSDSDYRLSNSSTVVIMNRLQGNGSLTANDQASLQGDTFVPAGNRSRVTLQVVHPFNWPSQQNAAAQRNFRDLVSGQINGLEAFVVFDQTERYQIELPAQISALEPSAPTASDN
jgi:hypothetical protein